MVVGRKRKWKRVNGLGFRNYKVVHILAPTNTQAVF